MAAAATPPPCAVFLMLYYYLTSTIVIVQFPFTQGHMNSSTCGGLFFLNCTLSPPQIQLGPPAAGGVSLQILNLIGPNKIHVLDPTFIVNNTTTTTTMSRPEKCRRLRSPPYNTAAAADQYPPSSTFAIYPNIPFLSCPKKHLLSHVFIDHHLSDCNSYTDCHDFDLYYEDLSSDPVHGCRVLKKEPDHIVVVLENCSFVHLPLVETPWAHEYGSDDLLQQLTPEYELEWPDSTPGCAPPCQDEDGGGGKRHRKLSHWIILVLVVCAGVAFLGLLCFLVSFLIRRRNNKSNGAYLLSRSISSGPPSTTSDLELGGGRLLFFGIPVFSYQELQQATNNFDPSRELGEGGFGTVYYGKLQDGREVAIKRLYEHNCKRVEQFLNEIKILSGLRHPYLVTLHGCTSRRSRELLLVYEYISNGTLADHLHGEMAQTSPLTWPVRIIIAIETASALAYLHESDIIHRDIKTHNILLDSNFCVKVADFGLSRLFPNDVNHISTAPQGTPGYVDPEYHQCHQLTEKSDVYSFGVVLIELISSMPAVDMRRHRHEINLANLAVDRIQRCALDELIDPSLGHQTDAEVARMTMSVAELAFRCLQLEKDLRPSMNEVLEFLKDIQAGGDCNMEMKERSNGEYSVPGKIITSPETDDDAVLLKGNIPLSPVTVTNTWPSGSSATTSSMAS